MFHGSTLWELLQEWNNMLWGNTALAASINFQAKIVTARNIVFTYQQPPGAVDVTSSLGASIILSGYCPGDYYSQTTVLVNTGNYMVRTFCLIQFPPNQPTTRPLPGLPVAGVPANDTCGTATTLTFNPSALSLL